jgi:hypothetical protein
MPIRNFQEFWPFYVGEHRNQWCRLLHYLGTSAGYAIAISGVVTLNPVLFPVALVVGYAPAWVGHFFIEGNKPASFKHPLWSHIGDLKMLSYALTGRMGAELERLEKTDFRFVSAAAQT